MTGDLIKRYTEQGWRSDRTAPSFALLAGCLARILRRRHAGDPGTAELDAAIEKAPHQFHEQIRTAFARGICKCESQIEKALLPWLIAQEYRCFSYDPRVLFPGEQDQLIDQTVSVVPQLPIGRYRADFALAAKRGGPIRFVIIECDGSEFHDSVACVKRDLNRDVRILASDRVLDIVRLSGKEIIRSPERAAWEASRALTHAWAKTNIHLGKKFSTPHRGRHAGPAESSDNG